MPLMSIYITVVLLTVPLDHYTDLLAALRQAMVRLVTFADTFDAMFLTHLMTHPTVRSPEMDNMDLRRIVPNVEHDAS